METSRYMGRNVLVERLTAQVGSKDFATALLKKHGLMNPDGSLTKKGQRRDKMTAEERAKDRASKRSNRPTSSYTYNPKTNRATLKGRRK